MKFTFLRCFFDRRSSCFRSRVKVAIFILTIVSPSITRWPSPIARLQPIFRVVSATMTLPSPSVPIATSRWRSTPHWSISVSLLSSWPAPPDPSIRLSWIRGSRLAPIEIKLTNSHSLTFDLQNLLVGSGESGCVTCLHQKVSRKLDLSCSRFLG